MLTTYPQCVTPLMVSTNMTKNREVNCLVKSAPGFVSEALNTVGHSSYTSGCLSHALQVRVNSDYNNLQIFLVLRHLNISPSLPSHPTEHGSDDTHARLASHVNIPHQKVTRLCRDQ